MNNNDTIYVSPLGFVIDEEELELRRRQINEVVNMLLSFDESNDERSSDNEKVS